MKSFPIGERRVSLLAHTDSPDQPSLMLYATAIGSHRPPFLFRVGGELVFRGPFSVQTPREFEVDLVGAKGEQAKPILEMRLPDAEIEGPTATTEQDYILPGTVLRTFKYKLRWVGKPSESVIAAELLVRDPWDTATTMKLPIHWEIPPDIEVIPARVVLKFPGQGAGEYRASVQIRCESPCPELTLEPEASATVPLAIHRLTVSEDQRQFTYEIACSADQSQRRAVFCKVIARTTPRDDRRLIIPVVIRFLGANP